MRTIGAYMDLDKEQYLKQLYSSTRRLIAYLTMHSLWLMGWTLDLTTLQHIATYKKDHNLYFKELLYRSKMTTEDIHQYLKGVEVLGMTYADSARPEIIEQLKKIRTQGNEVL